MHMEEWVLQLQLCEENSKPSPEKKFKLEAGQVDKTTISALWKLT